MKIRQGFVSNSSSSSFVIKNCLTFPNLNEIKDKIVQKVYEDYQERLVENEDWYEKHPDWFKYDEERYGTPEVIQKWVDVCKFEDYDFKSYIREFLGSLNDKDIIISDNDDNYFTEEVKEWIEATFDIDKSCWHMG